LENQLSEELTFSSARGEKLNWAAGLYTFHADGAYDPAGVTSGAGLFGPFTYVAPFARQVTESEAAFAQATYEVADATNLTVGARVTHENRDISGSEDGYTAGSTTPVLLSTTMPESLQFNKPTYRVAVDHHFTPDVMSYVSFNTGFKSGGFNTQFASQPAFLPETVKAYEIGMKDDLLDRLRLNFAAFDYEYDNIQIQKVGIANTGIINGATARIYGLDGDFESLLTDNFKITGSLAYLHARFLDFTNAPFGSPGGGVPTYPGNASGNDIPKSPRFTVNLTPDYRIPLANGSSIHLDGTVEYNSGYYFEPDNELKQPSFVRINASVRWESADAHYYARLFANNLTNREIASYSSTLADGSRDVTYEAPRLYGISVGYKF
jgi:iron complex outermembrane receptor protein